MKHFDVFYFDNHIEAGHPLDPRYVLTSEADRILELVSENTLGAESFSELEKERIQALVKVGTLRLEQSKLRFDTPVFLRQDADVLKKVFPSKARQMAERLRFRWDEIRHKAGLIKNQFDVEANLYHIICGMVFDGSFFNDLCASHAVAVSRMHPSGMDYLTIIYEKCEELYDLSRKLLCSWNRLSNSDCALQSFGDADGARYDFYRVYSCQALSERNTSANTSLPPITDLLAETRRFIQVGECRQEIMQLLERFGYVNDGQIMVPVFREEDKHVITQIGHIVAQELLKPVTELLLHCEMEITAVKHGVDRREIANELYHILFGYINEALVEMHMVAAPEFIPGEGRFLKSIQLF